MKSVGGVIDLKFRGPADANFTHLTGHQSGVRRDPASSGEDSFGCKHATNVFGTSFHTNEKDLFSPLGGCFGFICGKIDFPRSSTGSGGKSAGDNLGCLTSPGIKHGGKELTERIGRDPLNGIVRLDQLFLHHFDSDANGSKAGAFTIAGLKHEKAALFDSELEILHVVKVAFQGMADVLKLAINLRHFDLKLENGFRGANSSDHVFSLRVEKEFPIENFFARGRIACKGDARSAVVSGIAEDHGVDVHGGTPFVRNVVFSAINDRPFIVPGSENRTDSAT